MRKYYLDNIRWITVVLVVVYHVVYMYNGIQLFGVAGPFWEVQYQDAFMYLVYPWFMALLFTVSGVSSRLYLETHSAKEFIRTRTRKLLVPSTLGLLVYGWIQGYYNMQLSHAFDTIPDAIPGVVKYLIMALSGTGILWYIQTLWIFSIVLILIRLVEKDRLYQIGGRANIVFLLLCTVFIYLSSHILNMPMITVYRFGIYGLSFLLGYFVLSHEEVVERLSGHWHWLSAAALLLSVAYTVIYFGDDYTAEPFINNVMACADCWITILAFFAAEKKWGDRTGRVAGFMSRKSWGLYMFHYLMVSMFAYYQRAYFPGMPVALCYLCSLILAFAGAFALYEVISRIPVIRWFVLGIKKEKAKA